MRHSLACSFDVYNRFMRNLCWRLICLQPISTCSLAWSELIETLKCGPFYSPQKIELNWISFMHSFMSLAQKFNALIHSKWKMMMKMQCDDVTWMTLKEKLIYLFYSLFFVVCWKIINQCKCERIPFKVSFCYVIYNFHPFQKYNSEKYPPSNFFIRLFRRRYD